MDVFTLDLGGTPQVFEGRDMLWAKPRPPQASGRVTRRGSYPHIVPEAGGLYPSAGFAETSSAGQISRTVVGPPGFEAISIIA